MKILVTGGAGYKGSVLVPALLDNGYNVTVYDLFWFGDYLPKNDNLKVINDDTRNIRSHNLKGYDIVIHLAAVANDPCTDLDQTLSWEISCQATWDLIESCIKYKIPRIIYASSASVYGVQESEEVTEATELIPLTAYNKAKICAERILMSYADKINLQILRPATVCGLSPRMRLDVVVNLLTIQAIKNNKLTVLGGDQLRPNIHIKDLVNIYIYMIENPDLTGVYNAGFENNSVLEIAESIKNIIPSEIIIKNSEDNRSYKINSDKLLATGFKPSYKFSDAINEINDAFKKKLLFDEERWYNVRWMQHVVLKGVNSNL
jgi:nucleoside-diphosphate-sugar epimerase